MTQLKTEDTWETLLKFLPTHPRSTTVAELQSRIISEEGQCCSERNIRYVLKKLKKKELACVVPESTPKRWFKDRRDSKHSAPPRIVSQITMVICEGMNILSPEQKAELNTWLASVDPSLIKELTTNPQGRTAGEYRKLLKLFSSAPVQAAESEWRTQQAIDKHISDHRFVWFSIKESGQVNRLLMRPLRYEELNEQQYLHAKTQTGDLKKIACDTILKVHENTEAANDNHPKQPPRVA